MIESPAGKDNYNSEDFHQNSLTDSISLVILFTGMEIFVIHFLESISGSVFSFPGVVVSYKENSPLK